MKIAAPLGLKLPVTAASALFQLNPRTIAYNGQTRLAKFDVQSSLCNGGQSLLWCGSLQVSEGTRNLWGQGKKPLQLRGGCLFFSSAAVCPQCRGLIPSGQEVKLGTTLIPSQAYYELLNVRARAEKYFKSLVGLKLLTYSHCFGSHMWDLLV